MQSRTRTEAGRRLAAALAEFEGRSDVLVLALPRGGVPVAYEVARALKAPLDVFVVRKLGFPGHEEYAMGAIASGGVRVMNPTPGYRELERVQPHGWLAKLPPLILEQSEQIVVESGQRHGPDHGH